MVTKKENAILIIDMQNDFVLPDAPLPVAQAMATIPAIARFLAFGRERDWAVVYVIRRHLLSGIDAETYRAPLFENGSPFCVPGTKGAEIVDGLKPEAGDIIVHKQRFGAFFATPLDLILRRLGVKNVYVTGTQYPNCIRATAVEAMARDYATWVCVDCCSAENERVAEANIYDMKKMGIKCVSSEEIMRMAPDGKLC